MSKQTAKTAAPQLGAAQAASAMIVPADHPENVLEMSATPPSQPAPRRAPETYMTPEELAAYKKTELLFAMNPGMVERLLASPLGRPFRAAVPSKKGANIG